MDGRYLLTATTLVDGRVLVVGSDPNVHSKIAHVYDPRSGRWATTGKMVTSRFGQTATLLQDGRVLVAGGGGEVKLAEPPAYGATAELYDPTTGKWTATGKMVKARFGQTATLLPNGKVLVAGGSAGDDATARSAELYDPGTGKWTATGKMTTARSVHTATLLPDGRVLVAGGQGLGSTPEPLATAELYDPSAGRWARTGSMAKAGYNHAAALLANGRVLVVDGANHDIRASVELYDPGTGKWTSTGRMTVVRGGPTATTLQDGRVLVAGGSDFEAAVASGNEAMPLDSAELYDPASGRWTATASMSGPRNGHVAALLLDGRVFVTGDGVAAGPEHYVAAEIYDPGSP